MATITKKSSTPRVTVVTTPKTAEPKVTKTHRLSVRGCAAELKTIAVKREKPQAWTGGDAIRAGKENDAKPGFRRNMIDALQQATVINDALGKKVINKNGDLQSIGKVDVGFAIANGFITLV